MPAPWWMQTPVIASIGEVRAELPANRAEISVTFEATDKAIQEATKKAADRARDLGRRLAGFSAERVQVESSFDTHPLYEQYRNKDGELVDNQRADKIVNYAVSAHVTIRVRDVRLLQQVYDMVVAAGPTDSQPVDFSLEPSNEAKSEIQTEAAKDAARRARSAADAAGATLGPVKVIDPTGRACETDVLAGWPRYATGGLATDVNLRSRGESANLTSVSPVTALANAEIKLDERPLTLQPPMESISAKACIVYGLQAR